MKVNQVWMDGTCKFRWKFVDRCECRFKGNVRSFIIWLFGCRNMRREINKFEPYKDRLRMSYKLLLGRADF